MTGRVTFARNEPCVTKQRKSLDQIWLPSAIIIAQFEFDASICLVRSCCPKLVIETSRSTLGC